MNLPPTKAVGRHGLAVAVWRHTDGTIRYRITAGEQPAAVWRDVRDGFEPFALRWGPNGLHAAAYMATRDGDPFEVYHDLKRALETQFRAVGRAKNGGGR